MRIAFVSQPRDPIAASPVQRGSVAIVLVELARRLARRHEVLVLAPARRGEPTEEPGPEGMRIVRAIPPLAAVHRLLEAATGLLPGARPHASSRLYFAGYGRRLTGSLAAFRPDLVHVMTVAQLLPGLAAPCPEPLSSSICTTRCCSGSIGRPLRRGSPLPRRSSR